MKVSIIIPAHNEEGNIHDMIFSVEDLIISQNWDGEVIAVNDNSSDKTKEILEYLKTKYYNLKVIHRFKGNNGMGRALIEGTKAATGDVVIWTMADKSDDINTYPKMVEKISQGADMVFGSRYIPGGSRGDLDPLKAFLSSGYTKVTKLLFGMPVNDITNAFRAFRKEVFNNVILESGDFAISPEFAIKAHKKGFKLDEVPTTYSNRKAGKTKFKMIQMGLKYGKLFKYKFGL